MIDKLNQEEILRYLGYKDSGISDKVQELLDRCEALALGVIDGKYIYKRFPIRKTAEGICVEGTALFLKGKDIAEHLKNCREVVLLGATAGLALDRLIRRYMISEPDMGVVLDSCGIQAVEQIADTAEKEIESEILKEDQHLTWRFSPGYGDLPLETQFELVKVLDLPRKIGVTLTDSCLMIPSKSVTAILGIFNKDKLSEDVLDRKDYKEKKCDFCNNKEECSFRKRGTEC